MVTVAKCDLNLNGIALVMSNLQSTKFSLMQDDNSQTLFYDYDSVIRATAAHKYGIQI